MIIIMLNSFAKTIAFGTAMLITFASAVSVSAKDKSPRTVRIKIVADQHYAHQTAWKRKAARQLRDIEGEISAVMDIDFEIIEYELWEHEEEPDLYRLTSQMIDAIDRGKADAVIGFTFRRCPKQTTKVHADGVTVPYRGMMISTYHAPCPRNMFIPYVMIHEMIHLMGGVHVSDNTLMSPFFADTVSLVVDSLNLQIVRLTRDIDFQRGYASLEYNTLEELSALYDHAVEMGNNEVIPLFQLGAMYLVMEKYDRAQAATGCAIKNDSTYTGAWLQLSECLYRRGTTNGAVEILRKAIDHADDKGPVYARLAQLFFVTDDKENSYHYAVLAQKHGIEVDSTLWDNLQSSQEINK
jgi:tetratricopeptide (TPR) repeat protein